MKMNKLVLLGAAIWQEPASRPRQMTDEIIPFIDDPSSLYMVVSCVLGDLEARYHFRRDPVRWRARWQRSQRTTIKYF